MLTWQLEHMTVTLRHKHINGNITIRTPQWQWPYGLNNTVTIVPGPCVENGYETNEFPSQMQCSPVRWKLFRSFLLAVRCNLVAANDTRRLECKAFPKSFFSRSRSSTFSVIASITTIVKNRWNTCIGVLVNLVCSVGPTGNSKAGRVLAGILLLLELWFPRTSKRCSHFHCK